VNKRLLVIGIGISLAGGAMLYADANAKDAPAKMVLDKCKKKKSGVVLTHEAHAKKYKIECKSCHHTGKTDKSCASCHAGKAQGKKPGCQEQSLKKNPYHINCVGCHKKKKKGPKGCKDCHK
jgi:hypothetical protein